MEELNLKVVNPDGIFFEGEIKSILARSTEGDFMILKNHTPFVTVLTIGEMKINTGDKARKAAVAGGYLTVKDNEVVIMSDACEWEDEIDPERAERSKARAEKRIKEAKSQDDLVKAEISLKKAINRLDIFKSK